MTSTIKVDEIQNNAGTTTLAKLENDQLTGVLSPTGFRNRIINGDMRIDQRSTGNITTINSGPFVYCIDRWGFGGSANDNGVFTVQQQSDTPPPGFSYYVRIKTTTSDSSPSSSANYRAGHVVEGLNIVDLDWGTSNAKPVTFSFLVRSSLTGTFSVAFWASTASDAFYITSYTVNSANTWEYKTITIPGPTIGTWNTDNTGGVSIRFDLGQGSDAETSTTNTWFVPPSSPLPFRISGTTRLISTLNATLDITGVQLEKGSIATPFEFRSIGQELTLCQRFYQKSYPFGTPAGSAVTSGMEILRIGSTVVRIMVRLPVSMRATPTLTWYSETGAAGKIRDATTGQDVGASFGFQSEKSFSTSGVSFGSAGNEARAHWTADAEL